MVDLAKIRKKAKKGSGDVAPDATAAPSADVAPSAPAAPGADVASPGPSSSLPSTPHVEARAGEGAVAASENVPGVSVSNKLDAFKEQAGKRRGGAAAKVEAEDHERLELLTFVIAGEQYAVDIERIVEIVTPRPITRVPNADRSIVGIISLRGTIVTLVDVRGKLRHPAAGEANGDTRVVVIDFHNEMIGFVVDRVLRVVKAETGEIEPHPVVHANELDESIRGVFRAGGALTILLDLDKLLDHRWI